MYYFDQVDFILSELCLFSKHLFNVMCIRYCVRFYEDKKMNGKFTTPIDNCIIKFSLFRSL